MKLVIASERIPYQEHLKFLKSFIKWGVGISSYEIGKDTTIFNLKNKYTFNTAICYESIYPEFFSEFVNKGADFSVVITNDGWWGNTAGYRQHLNLARLRAIETRRSIARSANTGISCFIDPYGNMLQETEIVEKVLLSGEIGINKEKTFYTQHRDLTGRLCMYLSGVLILIGFAMKIFKKFT